MFGYSDRLMKRIVHLVLIVCLPLLVLALIEVGLRLIIPGNPPALIRKLGTVNNQSFMLFDREGPASFFGPQADRMSPAELVGFFMPKPTNTFRIILTGESAMRGFPQPNAFSAASFLEALLQDDYPHMDIEVLNFSATAIASFPVMEIVRAALDCEPDAIITMVGHNEFFGAYGVVATRHLGSHAALFKFDYRLRHTAIVRLINRLLQRGRPSTEGTQLMELMAGTDQINIDDPIRNRAAQNFERHLDMIRRSCQERKIPWVLCVPPSNETGLAPIGKNQTGKLSPEYQAREVFQAAQALQKEGRSEEARERFIAARDLDTMPWRATSRFQEITHRVGQNPDVILCDVDQRFREHAGSEGIGWNLMDDHVHPNIDGQYLFADAMRRSLWPLLDAQAERAIHRTAKNAYLSKMGDNIYDRFSVANTMKVLFKIPFLAESNPDVEDRFGKQCLHFLNQMPRETHDAVQQWNMLPMLTIGKRPLSGLAAIAWLKANRPQEAIPLLRAAINSTPPYSSWALEYRYFLLASIKSYRGGLDPSEIQEAMAAIERGKILLSYGSSNSGQTERFIGRLLQVMENHQEAIPYLKLAREKLGGMDYVANDRALIEAYQAAGMTKEAESIRHEGRDKFPEWAPFYK